MLLDTLEKSKSLATRLEQNSAAQPIVQSLELSLTVRFMEGPVSAHIADPRTLLRTGNKIWTGS
jgi:hypothetical protein